MRHALAAAILLFAVDAFADAKSDAQKHFELGLELFDAQAYDSALVEFLESRKLFPTRNALKNAGTCLRELKRYDEALDMYEELLQRFGAELPPADKAFVDAEIAKLSKYVGFLTIDSDQPGATVTIDGRARGTTPLAKPVRVQIGTHAVRVSKEGFSPYEATIQVSSGASETVKAKLSIVAKVGTVKVREAKGRAAKVVVDGAMVGAAPWEGTLASGNHTIALDAGTLVAEPKSIVVENGVVLDVSLSLEERQAELRVETTIAGAEVTIDGKTGSVARLPPGKHVASVDVPGYEHWEETVDLLPGAVVTLKATNPRKRLGYLDVNIGLVPWGGDITATEATQRKSFTGMLMFRYGRLLWHKLGVEAFLGIVFTRKSRDIDVVTLGGTESRQTSMSYQATLLGALTGASVSYRLSEAAPVTARLMMGVVAAAVFPMYELNYDAGETGVQGPNDKEAQIQRLLPVFGFELRTGIRASRVFVLDVGITALLIHYPQYDPPPWKNAVGVTGLPEQQHMTGGWGLVLPLTLGLHFDL